MYEHHLDDVWHGREEVVYHRLKQFDMQNPHLLTGSTDYSPILHEHNARRPGYVLLKPHRSSTLKNPIPNCRRRQRAPGTHITNIHHTLTLRHISGGHINKHQQREIPFAFISFT